VANGGSILGGITQPPQELLHQLHQDIQKSGGELVPDPEMEGAIGATMFDLPGSEDNFFSRTRAFFSWTAFRLRSLRLWSWNLTPPSSNASATPNAACSESSGVGSLARIRR
jgi:hypothetical protein